jgi:hypothetical protein
MVDLKVDALVVAKDFQMVDEKAELMDHGLVVWTV